MPESMFHAAAKYLPEPHRQLALKMGGAFDQDLFENYVVDGDYDGVSACNIIGYYLMGLVDGINDFLYHHFVGSKKGAVAEVEEFKAMKLLQEAAGKLDPFFHVSSPAEVLFMRMTETLEKERGLKEAAFHMVKGLRTIVGGSQPTVMGALTLQTVIGKENPFSVLWVNPKIPRSIVEWIMKKFLV